MTGTADDVLTVAELAPLLLVVVLASTCSAFVAASVLCRCLEPLTYAAALLAITGAAYLVWLGLP